MSQLPNDNASSTFRSHGLLNESASYDDIATTESRTLFLGGSPAYHEALHTGLLLCRFQPRTWSLQQACPWWILFSSFRLSNGQTMGGFADFLVAMKARINIEGQVLAPQELKLTCREVGSRFTLVRLIRSAYGFMGPTVPQRPEPCGGMMPLRGGEFRVWIPELQTADLQPVPVPAALRAESLPRQAVNEQELAQAGENATETASGGAAVLEGDDERA